ncbi:MULTISPECIES: YbaB/EbfC family nucleoid-associated protein [unclassified Crossiella]|uniref:YbaB/EbfC family nucleoid-associated protein n=1 Tax=unclassified Crossiella TaxID=2620835 RepID=UPI001FFF33FE|nr:MULTISPECIES: YbaB/EbfC family nucleoid-associated protein [unclassified Crossiella]MCK2242829.1 YbaB/EbfC family nucleoid-associated protein [Crossiella sp. S99.2]MCK2256706.1 YbaB/EbfC family nucleoid-associated protein [Crossiella sp. S99.1]
MAHHLPVIGAGPDLREWRRVLLALRELADTVTGAADSADGLITATVSARGELLDLWLDQRIYRTSDSARLAVQITGTVREAARRARARVAVKLDEMLRRTG